MRGERSPSGHKDKTSFDALMTHLADEEEQQALRWEQELSTRAQRESSLDEFLIAFGMAQESPPVSPSLRPVDDSLIAWPSLDGHDRAQREKLRAQLAQAKRGA